MAKKPVTSEVIEAPEATEVVVVEQVEAVEEPKPTAQTLAEMEAGREALAARAASARLEQGEAA